MFVVAKPVKMSFATGSLEVFHLMPDGGSDELSELTSNMGMILVVEDDVRTLRLERFVLEEEGFTVMEANSGEEALEALAETNPTLVLLDIGLPGMDGFATCEHIRESSQVPIIMVTAEDRDEDKVRGLGVGADDYVTKPFSTTELAARVKAVIRRSGMVIEPISPGPKPPSPEPPDKPVGRRPVVEPIVEETSEGTVRLAVKPTGSIRQMIHFVDELRKSQEFHLLRLVADQNREGMDIWLRLRGPMQLKRTLLAMEEVTTVEIPVRSEHDNEEQLLRVSLGG